MTDLNTEGPTTGQGVAAGGVDKAKEAALAEQGDEATPTSTAVPADTQVQAPSADDVTTSGEDTPASDQVSPGDQGAPVDPGPDGPTQEELDSMVDYTVKEGDIEKIPAGIQERDNLKVGDVVKLSKDHPLLESDDSDASDDEDESDK